VRGCQGHTHEPRHPLAVVCMNAASGMSEPTPSHFQMRGSSPSGPAVDHPSARMLRRCSTAHSHPPSSFPPLDANGWVLAGSVFIRGARLAPVTIAVMAGAFRDLRSARCPTRAPPPASCGSSEGPSGLPFSRCSSSSSAMVGRTLWLEPLPSRPRAGRGFALLALVPALVLSGREDEGRRWIRGDPSVLAGPTEA
jgi:hypothetical protein